MNLKYKISSLLPLLLRYAIIKKALGVLAFLASFLVAMFSCNFLDFACGVFGFINQHHPIAVVYCVF